MIPYGKHYLDESDIDAVVKVMRSGWITQGPMIRKLEDEVSKIVGSKYVVAVSSGTAALHIAMLASGIGSGDKIVTTTNSFVASANCILYAEAEPVLCDIDTETLNIDFQILENLILGDDKISGVIPVHFGGLPCDMARLSEFARNKNLIVIEDASHAFGAKYADGSVVGNCKYSDMTVFSLHPVKGITAGEGGLITTNNRDLYKKLEMLRSHGVYKGNFDLPGISEPGTDLVYQDQALENGLLKPWYYEMQELGFNYRITDIQCALVLSQLTKLNDFLARRREIVALYDELLSDVPNVTLTQLGTRQESANHIYVILINYTKINKSRANIMRELAGQGIGTQVHYIPISRHPYYNDLGFKPDEYPNSERYYKSALTIPVYYELTDSQVRRIAEEIINIVA